MLMGGKSTYFFSFAQSDFEDMTTKGTDIEVAASLSIMFFKGAADVKSHSGYEDYEKFSSTKQTYEELCIGATGACAPICVPSPTQTCTVDDMAQGSEEWRTKVQNDPWPMRYTLSAVLSFLTKDYFPDDPNIEAKQNNMALFLNKARARACVLEAVAVSYVLPVDRRALRRLTHRIS